MAQKSIVKYSDILKAKRFDAEYFKPEYLEYDLNIEKKGYWVLNEISDVLGGKRLPLNENFVDEGVPYIRAEDIKNSFIDYENVPKISLELHKKLINYQTKKDDILLTIVGNSIGDVGIVKFEIDKCNLTENAAKITNIELINPETLFCFLLSKYGQNQIHREKVGTAQPKLALERIRRFKIPLFSQSFQLEIKNIVKTAYKKQILAKKFYKEAERILLKELDLVDYKPKHRLAFTTTKKEVENTKRFDAEYFQPKYEEILEKIENYYGGYDTLGNVIKIKDENFIPKKGEKYKYIALANVSNFGYIQSYEENFGENLPTRARRKINTGDVIVSSIEGSLNSCALIEKEFDNSICSTGFYVLNSEKINSETLLILVKSLPLQMQLKRGCKGTILTAIPKDELKKIKIPLINPIVQQQISQKINQSHLLRKESKELLEEAKRKVEEEIDKG